MANDDTTDDTTDETPDTAPEAAPERVERATGDAETEARAEDFAETFKTAAQKVLEERFGMQQKPDGTVDFTSIDSEAVKSNAQALITGLMSQLAGVTSEQSATPKPESAPVPATADDNVIDLDAARRARAGRQPSDLERRISESIKATFNAYVQDNLVPPDSEGQVKLNVDGPMLRDHGPQMLTALFGAFTKSLFPEGGVEVDLGGGPKAAAPADDAEAPADEAETDDATTEAADATEPAPEGEAQGKVDVKLNVDVAGIFRGLLDGVTRPKT